MVYTNNTPKMIAVLTYAFLEWILIGLLFLDGLFSYLISAFAEFFGLDPPCFLCSHALGAKESHHCSRHLARAGHTCELKEGEDDDDEGTSEPETFDGEEESREMMAVVEDPIISLSRKMEVEERLIPLELVDFSTKSDAVKRNEDDGQAQEEKEDFFPVMETSTNSDVVNLSIFSRNDIGDDNSLMIVREEEAFVPVVESVEDSNLESLFRSIPAAESMDFQEEEEKETYGEFQAATEEHIDVVANCEISIGSEICDEEHIDLPHSHGLNLISICSELIDEEVEEERMPETPNSTNSSFRSLGHKKFRLERREFEFGTESVDGSVASEIDGGELVEHLKAALKSERTALTALYAELEEERSASAIAANQTMAMITRLQGEKAAMQMEALQYQRMMEEQSEYDQEALQLLNELMIKREREKQELEKELEAYHRKKKKDKEERRRLMSSSSSSGGSLSSNADDQSNTCDDVLSFAADHRHLISLDDSLAEFEEERTSILEQLKVLEEKLLSLDDDDDDDDNLMVHNFADANGHRANNGDYYKSSDVNCASEGNGFLHELDTNEKFHHEPNNVLLPSGGRRRLLPLFDATIDDTESDEDIDNQKKQLAIVEVRRQGDGSSARDLITSPRFKECTTSSCKGSMMPATHLLHYQPPNQHEPI